MDLVVSLLKERKPLNCSMRMKIVRMIRIVKFLEYCSQNCSDDKNRKIFGVLFSKATVLRSLLFLCALNCCESIANTALREITDL